ncbi:MAG TPA: ATPase domain-containing protein [Steroidobacteraceae bacterium]|nr:ATPase domain-containing protein [Steroidobacteraceae bacterium]
MTDNGAAAAAAELCTSGVDGLDEVLGGGLPRNCLYLVHGDPGCGKTTLALQFLLEGARRGERVFYITLSETRSELEKVALSHGWSLERIPLLELSAIESLLRPEAQTTVFHPSEVELNAVTKLLLAETRKHRPARVVFDSLSELRLMAETPLRYRRQLLSLKQELARQCSTALLLDDKMVNEGVGSDPHVLSVTHGVLEMEQLSPEYGKSRRRLRVIKLRAVAFREGYHDYLIERGGLRVFPRLIAAEHRGNFLRESVRSGIQELDELFGGGLDRGTTTLIVGHAGTGKSTLALQYATQAASRGERSVVFSFDEAPGIALARAQKLGLQFPEFLSKGTITLQQLDPAEISPGEFADRIQKSVQAGCRLLVIDSLNGYLNAMPGERYLSNQLHELSSYLNQNGVLTLFILAQHGFILSAEAPVDISYLADTVVSLRFFEAMGAIRTALSILKKRSGQHERTIREFMLEAGRGIRIGTPLREFQQVLTAAPVFRGSGEQMMTRSDGE